MNALSHFDPDRPDDYQEQQARARKIGQNKKEPNDAYKVLMVYKIASGFEQDKEWNTQILPLHARAAKALVSYLGGWKDAADCIQDTVEAILEWNPSAVISMQKILSHHAPIWKRNKCEQEAKSPQGIKII